MSFSAPKLRPIFFPNRLCNAYWVLGIGWRSGTNLSLKVGNRNANSNCYIAFGPPQLGIKCDLVTNPYSRNLQHNFSLLYVEALGYCNMS